ncbi:unnamed protein product [Linum trigynum]|uniref:Uncharacterized protein n=1 Tax=Linum trigynum TaxID=586398 RepID=A0AAV2CT81_9ROSI
MAPRLREREGDLSPGFVMDLVANFELGQEGKGLVGNNGKVEALPPPTPSVKVTTIVMSRHLIVEETQKMMTENRLAMEKNLQAMEENRQFMEESWDELVRCSHQTSLKLASLSSTLDRRLDQLFEVVIKNKNCLDKFKNDFIDPVVQEISLPNNGIDPPPIIATKDTIIMVSGGRTAQPRSGNSSPPVTSQPPFLRGGYGENITYKFSTHVEQPLVQTVTQETVLVSRSCMSPRNGKASGDQVDFDQLAPEACPPSLPPLVNGYGGCKPPKGQEEVHGSLPPDKLKMKSQAGGQVDVKKGEQNGVSSRTPYLFPKYGMGGISPFPCSGQRGMSSDMKDEVSGKPKWVLDTHATHDFHNFDSVSKSGQGGKAPCSMPPMNGRQRGMSPTTNNRWIDVPKNPHEIQATHAYDKHVSLAKPGHEGMSPILKYEVGGMCWKTQQLQATHGFYKCKTMAKSGQEGMPPIINSGHEVKSNKKRRGKAKKSSRSVENLAKYGQGGMSPTMNNGVGGMSKNLKEFQPTHACDKYASLAKCGPGGKSMSMSSKYMPSIMNDGHRGMHKKVSYPQTRHGLTKNQGWSCAKGRSQQGLEVERQSQVGHMGGRQLFKTGHHLQQHEESKHVSTMRKPRQRKTHGRLNMSSDVAKAYEHETPCKATKARHADHIPPIGKLENSKLMYGESCSMEEKRHVVYGWLACFNPWTWQWVYTFGALVVARGNGEQ